MRILMFTFTRMTKNEPGPKIVASLLPPPSSTSLSRPCGPCCCTHDIDFPRGLRVGQVGVGRAANGVGINNCVSWPFLLSMLVPVVVVVVVVLVGQSVDLHRDFPVAVQCCSRSVQRAETCVVVRLPAARRGWVVAHFHLRQGEKCNEIYLWSKRLRSFPFVITFSVGCVSGAPFRSFSLSR